MVNMDFVKVVQTLSRFKTKEERVDYIIDNYPIKKIAEYLLDAIEVGESRVVKEPDTRIAIRQIDFDKHFRIIEPVNRGRKAEYADIPYEEAIVYIYRMERISRQAKNYKFSTLYMREFHKITDNGGDATTLKKYDIFNMNDVNAIEELCKKYEQNNKEE